MSAFQTTTRFASEQILSLPTRDILPNPHQPRTQFSSVALRELADSIIQHGILQPLTVRQTTDGGWELVAGERRLRAALLAGLEKVPCVNMAVDSAESSVLALIENLQRRDLDFVEEAVALARLIDLHHLSQEEAARQLGKSQSAIANKLRLLRLPPATLQLLREEGFTERHARALLRLPEESRHQGAVYIISKHLNVAQTEEFVEAFLNEPTEEKPPARRKPVYIIKDVRLFLNSIQHNLSIMQRAGIPAVCEKADTEDSILLTIKIPKRPA